MIPARTTAGRRRPGPAALLLALCALAGLASSCAYYNTFYLARKYYDVAALRQPYLVDRPPSVDNANFNKSIDYSKKVLGQYPKSKWVDDAYLLWARGLLGRDDPGQTILMLQDFETRYPHSPILADAKFYLGVAYRQKRKYKDAATALQEFIDRWPKHDLAPYAHLEKARALTSLQDYEGAAAAAGVLLERWPKGRLQIQGRQVRAEASFKNRAYARAREDFHVLGFNAKTDEERLTYLLREADCLEAAQAYDEELALLRDAQSYEIPPPVQPEPTATTGTGGAAQPAPAPAPTPTNDRYGRLMVRIGTVVMLQGKVVEAIASFHSVVRDYPRTPLAAEAQYRIGFAYETAADDFGQARVEYAKVSGIAVSGYMNQAAQRLANLDRIAKFRGSTKDTVEAKAEAGFLLAEQYLFQIEKPERALEEYRRIEQDFAGTPWGAKAIVAQAWVLSRKLNRKAEADSLFWIAVRDHPATEAQLAARDYLEMEGADVPADWIKLPERQLARADTLPALTPVPETATALGSPSNATGDSLGPRHQPAAFLHPSDSTAQGPPAPAGPPGGDPSLAPASPTVAGGSGTGDVPGPAGPATGAGSTPARDSTAAPPPAAAPARDSTAVPAPADTTSSPPKP